MFALGVSARGCLPGQGVSVWPGGCLLGQGGVFPGGCTPPPPLNVDRMIDTFEKITFPQLLLQMVKRKYSSKMRTTHLLTLSGGGGSVGLHPGGLGRQSPSLPTGGLGRPPPCERNDRRL